MLLHSLDQMRLDIPMHNLKLAAVFFALKVWKHYLLEERFELYTDYKYVKYLFSQKELNMRQQRWLEFIVAYDFGIKYTPGKGNNVADAFSRKHQNVVLVMIAAGKDLEALKDCRVQ